MPVLSFPPPSFELRRAVAANVLLIVLATPALAQGIPDSLAPARFSDPTPSREPLRALQAPRAVPAPRLALASAKPFAVWSDALHSLRDSLVAMARAQIGTRYVHGGEVPDRGFDCSGLVQYVMATLRVELPRTAAQQGRTGLAIGRDTSRLRPGDLLTFGKTKRGVSHIGIYVGEGRYVHASSVAGHVIESKIDRPYSPLIKRWHDTRRVIAETPADSSHRVGG
ncbi:MAG TPA: C40 family peptidase [Gemmatimonadaceae bacterium]